jgi:sec-independent protein translocase protein TatA
MNITPMLIYGLGATELIIVLVILLILFGGSRLPSLAKGLGESIRSFKQGVSEEPEDKKDNTKPA